MDRLALYFAPGSIASAVGIALEELGLGYDLRLVDFAAAEQTKPAYRGINPKGRVPALQTATGILTETGAILEYLHSLAPEAGLIPSDPVAAAGVRETMYYLASTMHVAHAHKYRGARWADREESLADMRAKVPVTIAACCRYLEDSQPLAPFCRGGGLTAADPYLYVVTTWIEGDGVTLADYPKLAAFHAMMSDRGSVRAARDKGFFG